MRSALSVQLFLITILRSWQKLTMKGEKIKQNGRLKIIRRTVSITYCKRS
jgi:hypothetical protein